MELKGFLAEVHSGNASGEWVEGGLAESGFFHQAGEFRTAGEFRDRLGQVFVGSLSIADQQLSDAGQDIAEVPLVGAAEQFVGGEREFKDQHFSAGLADASHFSQSGDGAGDVSESEGDRDDLERVIGEGECECIGFEEGDSAAVAFLFGQLKHTESEVGGVDV